MVSGVRILGCPSDLRGKDVTLSRVLEPLAFLSMINHGLYRLREHES